MGKNFYYSVVAPDIRDFDNESGNNPGYRVEVSEHDGLVALCVRPANHLDTFSLEEVYETVLNPEETEQFINSLQNAVNGARARVNLVHPNRVRES